jgi:hypothetical protein
MASRLLSVPWVLATMCVTMCLACGGNEQATTSASGGGGSTGAAGGGAGAAGGVAGSGGTGAAGGTAGTGGVPSTGGGGSGGCGPTVFEIVPCGAGKIYACGDAIDNDGDGLVDWEDPDCLGPCDLGEDSFTMVIPGQPGPACVVDCFFDPNMGSGDDECFWSHQCDPLEAVGDGSPEPAAECPYDLTVDIVGTALSCAELSQAQSEACTTFCAPLVPNGCDCFGCCELPAGSGQYGWLGSETLADGSGACSSATIGDPTKCLPCTPVMGCFNDCAPCEMCIGKPSLPDDCAGPDGTPAQTCPAGIQPCGLPCQPSCPAGAYCITGCCQPAL